MDVDATSTPFKKPVVTGVTLALDATEEPEEDYDDDDGWHANEVDLIAERKATLRRCYFALLGFLITAVACLTLGALWARQRYKAQSIVASINGRLVTQEEYVHRMEMVTGADTLQRIADETLQEQFARKMGVTVTQAELDARYKQVSSAPGFPAYLAKSHQNTADLLNQLRMEMMLNKIVARQVHVSETDVNVYYRAMTSKHNALARFYTPPRVTIAVITTRKHTDILKAKQALDLGARFEDMVTRYSQDAGSRARGGGLPPIARGRTAYSKAPGIEKLLFGMKVGDIAGPVAVGPYWTLVRCLKQEPEVIQPRDQVDYECRVGAMMARLPKAAADKIHDDYLQFRQNAQIHTFRPELAQALGGR